jgi:rhodanese-related sulfurtransferase
MRAHWVAVVVLFAAAAFAENTASIEPKALLERVQRGDPDLVLLDVRTPQEFAAGHIPGAINIPYDELPARVRELPAAAQNELVLYCAKGARTEKAIARLREHGYTRLVHLRGDFAQWRASGLPEEK